MRDWFKVQILQLEDELSELEKVSDSNNRVKRAFLHGRIHSFQLAIIQDIITTQN